MRDPILKSFLCIVFLTIFLHTNLLGGEDKILKQISSSPNEFIFDYLPKQYIRNSIKVGAKDYILYQSKTVGMTSDEGKPQLPEEGTLIGIPPNTTVHVDIIESKFSVEATEDIAPSPKYTFDENNEALAEYQPDVQFYETENDFYPSQVVQVTEVAQLREQRVARIIIHPVQYNPVSKQIKQITHLRIRCTFTPGPGSSTNKWSTTAGDPQFESIYKSLIVNYPEAKQWRGKSIPSLQKASSDSTSWFVPGRQYYRIPVGQDGMYRLTFSELQSAGLNLVNVDRNSIAMYARGNSIPILVSSTSLIPEEWYIDFYARRNYGVNSYFDLYSDTSYYWLTVNDAQPLRYLEVSSIDSVPIAQPLYYRETVHFEQDLKYYFGYNNDEVSDPNDAPGEGWYWTDFFPTTAWNYVFTVDTVARINGGDVAVRARFHGMTKTSPPSQHIAEVRMNNILVGQISWEDNTEAMFSMTFPDSILRSGNNTLRLRSAPTSSTVNKFYVDWAEIDYNRPFVAKNNQLDFTSAIQAGNGPTKFILNGFTIDSVDIYDLSGARKISALSTGGGVVQFEDTAASPKHYLVVPKNSQGAVSFIEPKTFSNLRQKPGGADYIVITHHNFMDAATRLAQARATRGNLRTMVVDVQDIYDEFNYGFLSPDAIRDFLKQAYYNWPQPAPTYVVMFGDACWDFKGHLATTIKKNYVPAFGNPPSDNAIVSFDSVQNYLPFMLIGRLPVENQIQADRLVSKILNYDNPPVDDWNKRALFVTGGADAAEQAYFNNLSESLIGDNFVPPPIASKVDRIYKSSSVVIDGDSKLYMQNLVNQGLGFVNFLGHSGGRLWNVDFGNPNDLQNTNGKLPFISSVSCNVGFFSAPNFNVLSEDFLLADNRGGIAVWSGSSIGYANIGWWLTEKFLSAAAFDYGRSFGQLTTLSRIYFWSINGVTTPQVIQTLQLHPLLGDPYSMFALPMKPDIDVAASDVHVNTPQPTSDSILTLNITYRNYGLVPHDSIFVSVRDAYTTMQGKYAGEFDIVPPFYVPPIAALDSLSVRWDVRGKPGSHIVKISFDPNGSIPEVRKSNNKAETMMYVFKNVIAPLKPPSFSEVHSGSQNLVVSVPSTADTASLTYFFEVDTVADFSSLSKIVSNAVLPGPVSATWQTPSLAGEEVYFWRARSWDGSKYGAWTFSSFTTNDTLAAMDSITWLQSNSKQFALDTVINLAVTDSGVTMRSTSGVPIFVRSVGARVYPDSDYYSIIQIGDVKVVGFYFFGANSFIAARINPVTGENQGQGYDLRNAGQTDSLINFLQSTPNGFYVALSAVSNARTNVTEVLYQQIEALGSNQIRNVQIGQSWCVLSRKGNGSPLMAPLENYSPSGIATVQFQMPNYYGAGAGTIASPLIGPARQWLSLAWGNINPPSTIVSLNVNGVKTDSTVDSLMNVLSTSSAIDLSGINSMIYPRIFLSANLRNTDGTLTPILTRWKVVYLPTPDLATSAWVFHLNPATLQPGDSLQVDMDVYNIGFKNADTGKVTFTDITTNTQVQETAFGLIDVEGSKHLQFEFIPPTSPVHQTLKADVVLLNTTDAFLGNNTVYSSFIVGSGKSDGAESYEILFDGKTIINGDYVPPSPVVSITLPLLQSYQSASHDFVRVVLDGEEFYPAGMNRIPISVSLANGEHRTIQVRPSLKDGEHSITISRVDGLRDSVMRSIHFSVLSKPKLLNVYNYPNPFPSQTTITFIVTGSTVPENVSVKFYTIAGRMIRQLYLPAGLLQIGFNSITWDGRDSEGDEIANGYYFVKVVMNSNSGSDEVIQKILKLQ